MRLRLRENALSALAACAGAAAIAWLSLYSFAWNDYEVEALPAFHALTGGHVLAFLRLAPAYGGSLVERAPFALLPGLWGGGALAVYRMVALPCLLAALVLGLWLVARMRTLGHKPLARAVALGLCVANPLTLRALELGHPEELLGACLCLAAVLLAAHDRPAWAGILLGAAIANKEWALLAVGPVLLALPGRRALCMALAAAVAAAVMAPLALVGAGGFVAATRATASPPSTIFQPWQAWWFLGHHGPLVHGLFGAVKPGYRTAPTWIGGLSHPLIVALAAPLTALLWWRQRGLSTLQRPLLGGAFLSDTRLEHAHKMDALGLLALLMLLRCLLDTWDAVYYPLPFVLALLAWETLERGRMPLLALSSTALAWISFQWLPAHASADAQAAFFLAWTAPLVAVLALGLYAPASTAALSARLRQRRRPVSRPSSAPWTAH